MILPYILYVLSFCSGIAAMLGYGFWLYAVSLLILIVGLSVLRNDEDEREDK